MLLFSRTWTSARALLLLAAVVLTGCAKDRSQSVVIVFAASSMQRSLEQIARQYERSVGDGIVLVFGSTTDLSEQIANGAPADLLLAADEATIERLAARKLIDDSTRVVYAVGQLALVKRCAADTSRVETGNAKSCAPLSLPDLVRPEIRFIAIANPAYAPYGVAAREVLERTALWDRVRSRLVMGANILQADQYVTSGNADAGLIALSLVVQRSDRAFVVVDPSLHEPLRHVGAVVSRSPRRQQALRFLRFIGSDTGQATLREHGFQSPDSLTAS